MPIDPIRRPAMLPLLGASTVRPMFKSLGIASSGLSAQRQRMETIAQNIANKDVTRGPDGQPYKRREVILESATAQNAVYGEQGKGLGLSASGALGANGATSFGSSDDIKPIVVPVLPQNGNPSEGPNAGEYGVRVAGIAEDQGEGRLMYEPNHPDANADGYVRYPDIDTTQEMVKLLDAKRMYEANASVFQIAKSILRASIDI